MTPGSSPDPKQGRMIRSPSLRFSNSLKLSSMSYDIVDGPCDQSSVSCPPLFVFFQHLPHHGVRFSFGTKNGIKRPSDGCNLVGMESSCSQLILKSAVNVKEKGRQNLPCTNAPNQLNFDYSIASSSFLVVYTVKFVESLSVYIYDFVTSG